MGLLRLARGTLILIGRPTNFTVIRLSTSESLIRDQLRALLPRLHRFALTLSADPYVAQDLAQATCERVLSKADQFQPGTSFDRWAFSIMRSIWHNEIRRQRIRQIENFASNQPELAIAPEIDAALSVDARRAVARVMALPEAQREVVLLCMVEEQTYVEAAEILQIPVGTVMSRLSRARATLIRRPEGLVGGATGFTSGGRNA